MLRPLIRGISASRPAVVSRVETERKSPKLNYHQEQNGKSNTRMVLPRCKNEHATKAVILLSLLSFSAEGLN